GIGKRPLLVENQVCLRREVLFDLRSAYRDYDIGFWRNDYDKFISLAPQPSRKRKIAQEWCISSLFSWKIPFLNK
ncbi:MAG: hypothetical protein ACI9FJ_002852, partial [Alteromonadaceae bacterium]